MRAHRVPLSRSLIAVVVPVLLVAVACSGSSSPGKTSAGGSSTSGSSPSTSSTSGSGGAGLARARAAIAPYVGHPSSFPVTTPLPKAPRPGTSFTYLQCSSPFCALLAQLLVAPAKSLGVSLSIINSGSTAATAQTAASAALAKKPAAVLLPAGDPQLFGDGLHQLTKAGVAVVGGGIVGGAPYGVQATIDGDAPLKDDGKLMADWVTVNKGPKADIVFYGTPELSFSAPMQAAFKGELGQVCGSCKADYQQLSLSTIGNVAPRRIATYLQAHPSVNTVVFASYDTANGLPAALKVGNIKVTTLGFAPNPGNLEDIKSGGLTAGLGDDLPVQSWLFMDTAARLIAGGKVNAAELVPDRQFLTQKDLVSLDVSRGWTGYPNVAQRFAKLWPTHR